jgi:CBS domain-containing protein
MEEPAMNKEVKDLMEPSLVMISPNATLEEAARKMKEADCGFLPVGAKNAPQGIITDRDIVVRAIADGSDPRSEKVRDYMTTTVCTVKETDTLEDAARVMQQHHVSRLVVENGAGKISGVLTFGRIIRANDDKRETSEVVEKATGKAA